MSFLAKLIIDDNTMNVLECSFNFNQGADQTGRPSQRPHGGQIDLVIESTKKIDFLEWMQVSNTSKTGELIFYKRDNLASLKKIAFTDAHCLKYRESFNANDGEPLKTYLVISSKKIGVNSTSFENLWADKN